MLKIRSFMLLFFIALQSSGLLSMVSNLKSLTNKLSELNSYFKNPGMSGPRRVIEKDCPICFETTKDIILTPCKHEFCKACLRHMFEGLGSYQTFLPCPLCRAELTKEWFSSLKK